MKIILTTKSKTTCPHVDIHNEVGHAAHWNASSAAGARRIAEREAQRVGAVPVPISDLEESFGVTGVWEGTGSDRWNRYIW